MELLRLLMASVIYLGWDFVLAELPEEGKLLQTRMRGRSSLAIVVSHAWFCGQIPALFGEWPYRK